MRTNTVTPDAEDMSRKDNGRQRDYFIRRFCSIRGSMLAIVFTSSLLLLLISITLIISNIVTMEQISKKMEQQMITSIVSLLGDRVSMLRLTLKQMQVAYETNLVDFASGPFKDVERYTWHCFYETAETLSIDYIEISLWNRQNRMIMFSGSHTDNEYTKMFWTNNSDTAIVGGLNVQNKTYNAAVTELTAINYTRLVQYETTQIVSESNIWGFPHIQNNVSVINTSRNRLNNGYIQTMQCNISSTGIPVNCRLMMPYYSSFRDADGNNILSVFKIDAARLSSVFSEYKSFKGSRAFLFHHSTGRILASSQIDLPVTTITQRKHGRYEADLIPVHEYSDPLVAATAMHMKKAYGDDYSGLEFLGGTGTVEIDSNEIGYFRTVFWFKGKKIVVRIVHKEAEGMDWVHVLAVPQLSYYGNSIPALTVASALACICISIGLIVGVVSTCSISAPIKRMAKEMRYLENMQLDAIDSSSKLSMFSELASIQAAFSVAVFKLREYKAYLPRYILERDFGEEQTRDEERVAVDQAERAPKDSISSITNSSGSSSKTLVKTYAVVLIVDFDNFHDLFNSYSFTEMLTLQSELLQIVDNAVTSHRGILYHWQHNKFKAVWSKSREMKMNACNAALKIQRRWHAFVEKHAISTDEDTLRQKDCVRCTLSYAHCYKGPIGSSKQKQYAVFGGDLEVTLRALKRIARENRLRTVICDRIAAELDSEQLLCRPVAFLDKKDFHRVAYELVRDKRMEEYIEWMYEFEETRKNEGYTLYLRAFELLGNQQTREALEFFQLFNEQKPGDVPTLQMIKHCQNILEIDASKSH